ncbi:tetratricopeptide repeat protein, partial [Neisseria sp. P0021.S007]
YRKAATKGSGDAAAALAQHSLTGKLIGRDPLQAMRHTRFAADRRHPEALRIMGDLYRYGLGVKADPHAAHDYYHRAATLGSATAIQKLLSDAALHNPQQYEQIREAALLFQKTEQTFRDAEACHYGIGTAVDYDRARKLYLEAAEFHHKNAAATLGKLYYYGQGVEVDFQSAAHWFEIAAEQGHTEAQYYLARLYYHGQGVSSHIPTACRWLQAA